MSLFPMFVKLQGRTVAVVGAGPVAEQKIPGLFAAEASVRVIAPGATPQIVEWAIEGKLIWHARAFAPSDLDGVSLAIAATSAPGVNHAVFLEAEARGIFCNAVDDIENCHFYYGAVVQRGDLQLAISTNGKSPALAQRIRKELEDAYTEEYGTWLDKLGKTRDALRRSSSGGSSDPFRSSLTRAEQIKSILHRLAAKETFERVRPRLTPAANASRKPAAQAASCGALHSAAQQSNASSHSRANVYLVGAGPGDPDLLTQKAARLLQNAQVVLHDSLVSREVLALISPAAKIIDVGKRAGQKLLTQEEINALLLSCAQDQQLVVRLKGGDPSIFGRAGEELQALRRANIAFEIVPGVTAATAAAAAAKISLTDRRVASQVLLTTFSRGADGSPMDWGCLTSTTTLVLYMPGPDYAEVSERLQNGGLPADLPCAVISAASNAAQKIRWSTISHLATEEKLPTPALLIVGRVAQPHAADLTDQITQRAWSDLENSTPALRTTRLI